MLSWIRKILFMRKVDKAAKALLTSDLLRNKKLINLFRSNGVIFDMISDFNSSLVGLTLYTDFKWNDFRVELRHFDGRGAVKKLGLSKEVLTDGINITVATVSYHSAVLSRENSRKFLDALLKEVEERSWRIKGEAITKLQELCECKPTEKF